MSGTTQLARFALVSRVAMLVATSFTVILTTRTLGASGQGDWALLQFGLLLVTGLAGFVAGGAVVYVRRFFSAKAMVPLAVAGIAVATACTATTVATIVAISTHHSSCYGCHYGCYHHKSIVESRSRYEIGTR